MTVPAQPIRVIVIYGDASDLAVLASLAGAYDLDLHIVEPDADVLGAIAALEPEAIILDVKLRVGDGYALCVALKADPLVATIPIILTGTDYGREAARLAYEAGCDDFFEKPIRRHILAYRLRALVRLRRAWMKNLEK